MLVWFVWYIAKSNYVYVLYKRQFLQQRMSNMDRVHQLQVMLEDVMTPAMIEKTYVVYGTLLGVIRDNSLICYDDDIDIQANVDDYSAILEEVKHICSEKSEYTYSDMRNFICSNIMIIHKPTGLCCDITFVKQKGDKLFKLVPFGTLYNQVENQLQSDIIYPVKTIPSNLTFSGYISIPQNANKYLINQYGVDYMTPNRQVNDKCEFITS